MSYSHIYIRICMHNIIHFKHVAAQMWCLIRLLPLLIGDKVPETCPHWQNYLLCTTVDYLLAPVLSLDSVAHLRMIINHHHIGFSEFYPSCRITHYIIHYPEWIAK